MADLSVNYCGVRYPNPLVLASATPAHNGKAILKACAAGIGGIIPKTIGDIPSWGIQPVNGRMHVVRHNGHPLGMINIEMFSNKPLEDWLTKDLVAVKETGVTMHLSVLAMPQPEDTAKLIDRIQATGLADLFELNVSCPMPKDRVGINIGRDLELTCAQIRAAKSVSRHPVTIKVTPNTGHMPEMARACQEAGVDGLTVSNTVSSFTGVDIETGEPYLRGYGGYSGPAIKPIVMKHLTEVARYTGLPISASGGAMNYRDVIEYIMLGATTVQLCTSVMWNGVESISSMLADLNRWMDAKGYQSFDQIRGIALDKIRTVEEISMEPAVKSVIDQSKCTNCGKCEKVCFYDAIRSNAGQTARQIDPPACDSCGLCVQLCPAKAIRMRS